MWKYNSALNAWLHMYHVAGFIYLHSTHEKQHRIIFKIKKV